MGVRTRMRVCARVCAWAGVRARHMEGRVSSLYGEFSVWIFADKQKLLIR